MYFAVDNRARHRLSQADDDAVQFQSHIGSNKISSRSFVMAGKVDGLVFMDGGHYLLEHKTAGLLDGNYLERLWTDFQITLYSHYIEQALGIKITGVLYNILVKAKLKQSEGETEEEFEVRRAELIAKSKTGKTTAQRKLPELDEEFQARLYAKYDDPNMFHREQLLISRDQFRLLQEELWDLTQQYLAALHALVEKVIVHDKDRYEFWFRLPDGSTLSEGVKYAADGEVNSLSVNQLVPSVCNQEHVAPRVQPSS